MLRSTALLVAFVALCLPVLASEPGNPLDCSDWVFLEPGFSCVDVTPWPCPSTPVAPPSVDPVCVASKEVAATDNRGAILAVRMVTIEGLSCPNQTNVKRLELFRNDNGQETVLGYIDSRCGISFTENVEAFTLGPGYRDERDMSFAGDQRSVVRFDPVNGALYVTAEVFCTGNQCPYDGTCPWVGCVPALRVFRFEGFETLFDILQSYEPSASGFGFRIPYMPEGFQYADYFDTYYGDLATVGNWSQAQPLKCGYPATAPSVGDYLTVEDTLPTPASGQGYYYVTAVNYQGQRRYGRQSNGGVLSGRDPAVLPACAD